DRRCDARQFGGAHCQPPRAVVRRGGPRTGDLRRRLHVERRQDRDCRTERARRRGRGHLFGLFDRRRRRRRAVPDRLRELMMSLIDRTNFWRGVATLGFVLLAGCGASSEDNGVKTPLPRQGNIRVVNAIPDSGSMSSFLSTSVFAINQYAESTDLRPTLVGQYVMNILLTPPDDVN